MTQHYLLPCACGQKLRVAPAQAGGQVSCGCGQNLTVPTLRGLRELEPAKESGPAASAPGWSAVHGAIFAVSLLVAAAGLGIAGYYLALFAQVRPLMVDETDLIVSGMDQSQPFDKLSPAGALDYWQKEVLTGLKKEVEPVWVAAKSAAARYLYWVKVGVALMAGGLVPAVATLFIGRGNKPAA